MTTMTGCGAKGPAEPETQVLIKTTLGDVTVALYNDTPEHRMNFVRLVEQNFYDSVLFHRVIRDFMVQTGDPDSKNAKRTDRLGAGDPGYTLPAEISTPGKHYHKYGALAAARTADQVNPERRSSGSQFYIVTGKKYKEYELQEMQNQLQQQERQNQFQQLCVFNSDLIMELQKNNDTAGLDQLQSRLVAETDSLIAARGKFEFSKEMMKDYTTIGGTPFLDGQYTVFGEVLSGMDVVEQIQKANTDSNDRPIKDIRVVSMEILQ